MYKSHLIETDLWREKKAIDVKLNEWFKNNPNIELVSVQYTSMAGGMAKLDSVLIVYKNSLSSEN